MQNINDIKALRARFPQLSDTVYGKPLVYLDNAATSLRPQSVIDKWSGLSAHSSANLHRAVHSTALYATKEYEDARDAVRTYINARCREEIIFTSGATASINLVSFSFGESFIRNGDEIIVSEAEHHSNIVPWQMLCQRRGAVLKVLPVDDSGNLRIDLLPALLTERTGICCVSQVSNVLGMENPIRRIVEICHAASCPVLVDGAQGIVHRKVDVQALGCDFYVFSGHKIYAAPGTGVLYGTKELLDAMVPYMGGGEMIENVSWNGTSYAPLPQKFEAGTQNFAGVPTLVPALQTASDLLSSPEETERIKRFVYDALISDPDITLYGRPDDLSLKMPLFSISVKGAHHEDLALIMDKMGIALRSGQMCAEPLMDRFGVTGMLRASFAPYNTLQEAEYFIECLQRAKSMLK